MPFDLSTAVDVDNTQKVIPTTSFDINSAQDVQEPQQDAKDRLYFQNPPKKNFIDSITSQIGDLFRDSPEENIAKAQNIYAISKVNNIPIQEVQKNIDTLQRDPRMTGIRPDTMTNEEYATLVSAPLLGQAFLAAPVGTAVSVGAFTAIDKMFNLNQFVPTDASDTTKTGVQLADWIVKGGGAGATGAVAEKAGSKMASMFFSRFIDGLKPNFQFLIKPEQIKALQDSPLPVEAKSDLIDKLGINENHVETSLNNNLPISVPPEKILDVAQQPYWDQVKEVLAPGVDAKPVESAQPDNGFTETKNLIESFYNENKDLFQMQDKSASEKQSILQSMSRQLHEDLAQDPSFNANPKSEGQLQVLLTRLSETGKVDEAFLRSLLEPKSGSSPSGLQETVGSDVVLPEASSPATSSDLQNRYSALQAEKQSIFSKEQLTQEDYARIPKLNEEIAQAKEDLGRQSIQSRIDEVSAWESPEGKRNAIEKMNASDAVKGKLMQHFKLGIFEPEVSVPKENIKIPEFKDDLAAENFAKEHIGNVDVLKSLETKRSEMLKKASETGDMELAHKAGTVGDAIKVMKKEKLFRAPTGLEPPPKAQELPANQPEPKIAKASSDINKKIVEKGFQELSPEQQAQFNPITKKEQTQKVSELIGSDLEKSKRMAKGEEPIPNDINPQVLFNAVKNKALKELDVATLRDLASSPIAKERSLAAQSLSASGFDNGIVDPVKAMQDVELAREKASAKNAQPEKSRIVKEIKNEIKKVNTKENWDSFIKSLEC